MESEFCTFPTQPQSAFYHNDGLQDFEFDGFSCDSFNIAFFTNRQHNSIEQNELHQRYRNHSRRRWNWLCWGDFVEASKRLQIRGRRRSCIQWCTAHAKQPLVSTQSRRDKGAWGKERPTQAIWLLLCTSQKILPVVRLSWLDSLGENSSTGTGTKTKIDLLGHCMVANSRSKFLDKYLQIAHSLGCLTEETERTIEAGQLDELASLRILSKHVKKELRKRPGWLLIIDGLSLDEELVKELRPFRPQPNDENWGKGQHKVLHQ